MVDNVTNTSLALANTQFIESRVQDDDIEKNPEEDDDKQEVGINMFYYIIIYPLFDQCF